MGKIFCLMGKSSSGKDTVYNRLKEKSGLPLYPIIPGTTRPIRSNEIPGREYAFYTEEELATLIAAGKVIELRSYDTIHGIWKYFTTDNQQIDLSLHNYLIIGTLSSYLKMQDYFGKDKLVGLYLYMDDGLRLERALKRERSQHSPKYTELCRRFLADEQDFSEENLSAAGINRRFFNETLPQTVDELTAYIISQLE